MWFKGNFSCRYTRLAACAELVPWCECINALNSTCVILVFIENIVHG